MLTGVTWQTQVKSSSIPGTQTKTGSLMSLTLAWVSCPKPLTCQVRRAICKGCVRLARTILARTIIGVQWCGLAPAAGVPSPAPFGCLKGQTRAQPHLQDLCVQQRGAMLLQ